MAGLSIRDQITLLVVTSPLHIHPKTEIIDRYVVVLDTELTKKADDLFTFMMSIFDLNLLPAYQALIIHEPNTGCCAPLTRKVREC